MIELPLTLHKYGYHTASLNQIQGALTCRGPSTDSLASPPSCVPMTDAIFGAVTSSFTVGGFVGSSCASVLLEKFGRRGALVLNSLCIALGSAAFGSSSSVAGLIGSRCVARLAP